MEISWSAPEYMHTYKTTDWYWIVGIVTVTFAIISIILGDFVFAVFLVVAIFTLSLYASRPPKIVPIALTDRGLKINDVLYPWSSLESFWIEEEELHPRILFKSEKRWSPYVIVLLDPEFESEHADEIHRYLSTKLPEEKHSEPFLEKLLIWLGF